MLFFTWSAFISVNDNPIITCSIIWSNCLLGSGFAMVAKSGSSAGSSLNPYPSAMFSIMSTSCVSILYLGILLLCFHLFFLH